MDLENKQEPKRIKLWSKIHLILIVITFVIFTITRLTLNFALNREFRISDLFESMAFGLIIAIVLPFFFIKFRRSTPIKREDIDLPK